MQVTDVRIISKQEHTLPGNYTIRAKTRDVLGVESTWGETTVEIRGRVLQKALLVGKIDNYEYIAYRDEIQFTATNLWVIDNKPLLIKKLTSEERIYTGKPHPGILTSTFACGFFDGYILLP